MNKTKQSIRACLEEQAKAEFKTNSLKKSHLKKKKFVKKADSLGLNWRDAVVFSIMMVFGCGYWLQAGTPMVV
jgi:predicted ABC-type exoprotein transport system permease subunit